MIDTHCIYYDDYLADDDNDDKEDDKATDMLGANDDDGRYHEDKSMTFSKQVKHTLNYKLEILVSQELTSRGFKATSFPESSWGTSRRGACERVWGGGWKALRMGGWREIK